MILKVLFLTSLGPFAERRVFRGKTMNKDGVLLGLVQRVEAYSRKTTPDSLPAGARTAGC